MGNVIMEAHQIHYKGKETAKTMFEKLDSIAQQVGDLPTFTSNDRVFLEKLPALPTVEGKTVLTAVTDDQGETEMSYAAPEVEGADVAPEFSDEISYSSGDLVYYEGQLFKFTSDHAIGSWDPTEATPTTVAAEFRELKNTLSDKVDKVGGKGLSTNDFTDAYKTAIGDNTAAISALGNPIVLTEFGSTTAEQKTIDYTKYHYLLLVLMTPGSGALTIDATLLTLSSFQSVAVRTYVNGNGYYGIIIPTATNKVFNCSVSSPGCVCTVYGIK